LISNPAAKSATSRSPRARISLPGLFTSLLIAAAIAFANGAFWQWSNRPVVTPGFDGQIGGFAFNGYQRDESPRLESFPSEQELASDLQLLSKYTDQVRTYSSIDMGAVPELARDLGMKVTAGAWLNSQKDRNALEIKALLQSIRENSNITRVIVGNETVLRGDLSVAELERYLDIVRRREPKTPVSTAEPWHIWLKYPDLVNHVDFITVHLLPYWEGVQRQDAVTHVLRRYEELRRAYPRKKILIGEVGWPSNGDRVKAESGLTYATASVSDEAQFLREFLPAARAHHLEYFLMEAFDQPWKRADEGRTGAYWGMFNADRTPKFSLEGPIVSDPAWPKKALVASMLAFLPIMWFAYAFRRFRLAGRLFFGILIQAAATLVIWIVTLPFEFYLNSLDWTMLVVLLPALAAMLMILLANGFEFAEATWCGRWLREFRPEALPPDAVQPFVSIHLPCHNEPPEMVIQTLASLARMDYQNFEILVIDNNTKNEAVWRPVERYVAALKANNAAPKVRFFHLDNWPGFKAGALNFALGETDPRAEIVGVVDSDYVVRQDWLSVTVSHFHAPRVAVVQAPQAHRDWQHNAFQRMCSWEYDGFFRIGMHHRNERDAIIQHGTMTLVRKTALSSTGGWSEWCICEDAELGLRLMHAGWETRYIDEVLGRGLTPSNFAGYKSQRFRWAFGAMQILKRRWGWLWGDKDGQPGLTGGQRFHFLTGWFSWFADALHLFFTLASVGWTVGMILSPEHFSLPLDLFVIPVLGFFVLKAFFGPALYRVRVDCGWADVWGASLASMALSHAIARGILLGLTQKRGTFVVTPKSWQLGGKRKWIGAVREELVLLTGIAVCIGGTLYSMPMQYETLLWTTILATQAIPYLSAFAVALISAQSSKTSASVPHEVLETGQRAPLLLAAEDGVRHVLPDVPELEPEVAPVGANA
jgi:exo-beta-1,3-glucanase (GH17 family)/cellulose synthase/poly-beta-1,6-N-acetylglucosamine synthase-like glycosyltransferase